MVGMRTANEMEFPCEELWHLFAITPLNRSEALRLMTSLAYAIEDLHSLGELWDHCEKGVEILANGFMKIHGTVSNRNHRLHGSLVDPYRSIAPPEFIHSNIHDVRSDIFAWGIIAYEFITGECPIKGETLPELIDAATKCEFPSPHILKHDWPERLSKVVMKALSKEPDNRYRSVRELIEAISFI
jgi:serine/threonine protein kinase